jgi:L-amino acid N-acyltransferase YncA
MLIAKEVATENELQQILALQKKYLSGANSTQEEREQGFVTVHHSMEKLQQLHALAPSVVVKENDHVIAYALVMLNVAGNLVPELLPMFALLKTLSYGNKPLNNYNYYVMGQICIDKPYRSQGVFPMLYHKHRELMQHKYDFVITEIATRNTRSLRAHEKVGFRLLHNYTDATDEWDVVLWNWQ